MTEIFSAWWGKKRRSTDGANSIDSMAGFTSYVNDDMCDEFKDFVVIETPTDVGKIYPHITSQIKIDPNRKYEDPYNYSNSNKSDKLYGSKMGSASSTCSGDSPQTETATNVNMISMSSAAQNPIRMPQPQFQPTFVNEQQQQQKYEEVSFLSGVPFKLSNELLMMQSFKNFDIDGFKFLTSKDCLMESLCYDFHLENNVLQECCGNNIG